MFFITPSEFDFDSLLELKNHVSEEPVYLHNFMHDDIQDLFSALKRNSVTAMLVIQGHEYTVSMGTLED